MHEENQPLMMTLLLSLAAVASVEKMKVEKTECKVALYSKNKGCQWYMNNGCSKHMNEYQRKLLKLMKKEK
jgi:hypothetical protein